MDPLTKVGPIAPWMDPLTEVGPVAQKIPKHVGIRCTLTVSASGPGTIQRGPTKGQEGEFVRDVF